jgi:hypothetical protein
MYSEKKGIKYIIHVQIFNVCHENELLKLRTENSFTVTQANQISLQQEFLNMDYF